MKDKDGYEPGQLFNSLDAAKFAGLFVVALAIFLPAAWLAIRYLGEMGFLVAIAALFVAAWAIWLYWPRRS